MDNNTTIFTLIQSDTFLSWFGAVVSILGTMITVYYAFKTKSIKEEIYSERKKISLKNTMDELKKVQPHILRLQKQSQGTSNKSIIHEIRIHIDLSISNLKRESTDENLIRQDLQKTQELINLFSQTNDIEQVNNCQVLIQDVISDIRSLLDKEEIK